MDMLGTWELDSINHCDALTLTRGLPDASVDLIATDPPFNIGKADWDSWATLDDYLAWLDEHLREFKRVLKPNGSLYLFAATKYAAQVELTVGAHFNVLNAIRWQKPAYSTKAEMFDKETMRAFFPASETVIFAEQFGADQEALGTSGEQYFEPIRVLLNHARKGRSIDDLATASGLPSTQIAHYFSRTKEGWRLPSQDALDKLGFNMRASMLRKWYSSLRHEYEALRRPFFASADAPYTDVWDFDTVNTYPGKHLCEKPLDMCRHIVRVSSRRGALVLDPFCGSGNMLRAAFVEGRHYLGGDSDAHWARKAGNWIPQPFDLPLFAAERDGQA